MYETVRVGWGEEAIRRTFARTFAYHSSIFWTCQPASAKFPQFLSIVVPAPRAATQATKNRMQRRCAGMACFLRVAPSPPAASQAARNNAVWRCGATKISCFLRVAPSPPATNQAGKNSAAAMCCYAMFLRRVAPSPPAASQAARNNAVWRCGATKISCFLRVAPPAERRRVRLQETDATDVIHATIVSVS